MPPAATKRHVASPPPSTLTAPTPELSRSIAPPPPPPGVPLTAGGDPTGCGGRSPLELVPLTTSAASAGGETVQPSGPPPPLGCHSWRKQRLGVAVAVGEAVAVELVVALGVCEALGVAVTLLVGLALTDALPVLERVCVEVALPVRVGDGVTWQ